MGKLAEFTQIGFSNLIQTVNIQEILSVFIENEEKVQISIRTCGLNMDPAACTFAVERDSCKSAPERWCLWSLWSTGVGLKLQVATGSIPVPVGTGMAFWNILDRFI